MEGEGNGCRMREFARWNRTLLQHEREGISAFIDKNPAYLDEPARAGLLHDLTDIDYLLSQMPPEENPSPLEK
jgi:hypothetical protein